MTEPVIKMVGLANDDKPNAVADIFADQMQDRIADHVTAAKDVISNNLFGTELEDNVDEIDLEPEVDDSLEDGYDEAEEVETEEPQDYEADQEQIEEPAEQEDPSEESEEN
jgi:hypothetical protein|tara:strand:+ start:2148 stop:2480 length:333 start_codon:yes stop_codon:yes gene_type:complete